MGKVERFKTFEEAEIAGWCFNPDETYLQRVAELWKFAERVLPVKCPNGIFRYRTLEQANKEEEQWIVSKASSTY